MLGDFLLADIVGFFFLFLIDFGNPQIRFRSDPDHRPQGLHHTGVFNHMIAVYTFRHLQPLGGLDYYRISSGNRVAVGRKEIGLAHTFEFYADYFCHECSFLSVFALTAR